MSFSFDNFYDFFSWEKHWVALVAWFQELVFWFQCLGELLSLEDLILCFPIVTLGIPLLFVFIFIWPGPRLHAFYHKHLSGIRLAYLVTYPLRLLCYFGLISYWSYWLILPASIIAFCVDPFLLCSRTFIFLQRLMDRFAPILLYFGLYSFLRWCELRLATRLLLPTVVTLLLVRFLTLFSWYRGLDYAIWVVATWKIMALLLFLIFLLRLVALLFNPFTHEDHDLHASWQTFQFNFFIYTAIISPEGRTEAMALVEGLGEDSEVHMPAVFIRRIYTFLGEESGPTPRRQIPRITKDLLLRVFRPMATWYRQNYFKQYLEYLENLERERLEAKAAREAAKRDGSTAKITKD